MAVTRPARRPRRHLDIGCGLRPHNPYGAEEVFGVDLHAAVAQLGPNFRCADFVLGGLPYGDNEFDSVSAIDVLEHVPRHAVDFASGRARFPFLELMSEVFRVLRPDGLFYAYTPCYPSAAAFQDPTHVNFITRETHLYFCDPDYLGRYGFRGRFRTIETRFTAPRNAATAVRSWRGLLRDLHRRLFKGGLSHLVWQLQALK